MEEIKKILDEQKHICQTEFDKRSKLIDGIWYVACEDVLNAPYPKQILIDDVRLSLLDKLEDFVAKYWYDNEYQHINKQNLEKATESREKFRKWFEDNIEAFLKQ